MQCIHHVPRHVWRTVPPAPGHKLTLRSLEALSWHVWGLECTARIQETTVGHVVMQAPALGPVQHNICLLMHNDAAGTWLQDVLCAVLSLMMRLTTVSK